MNPRIKFILCWMLVICCCIAKEIPRTRIKQGEIIGTTYSTYRGREVYVFFGVPYAEPPVGQMRFREPQPRKPWTTPLKTTERPPMCQQPMFPLVPLIVGSEDCLYANVFTPLLPKNGRCEKLLPIFFNIHQSAYLLFDGSQDEPYFILDKTDLVFVTFNYRLGILGFLSTGDEVVPGNNGLKDMVLMLKWVRENAESFCGDVDRITVSGASSGAVSVGQFLLSNMTRGLFKNAISSSGTASTTIANRENIPSRVRVIANQLNCPTENSQEMVDCLRTKSYFEMWNLEILNFRVFFLNTLVIFGPTVEPCVEGAFMTQYPTYTMEQKDVYDVPYLITSNQFEGLILTYFIAIPGILEALDLGYQRYLPIVADYNTTIPADLKPGVSNRLRYEYFKNKPISFNDDGFKNLATDFVILSDTAISAAGMAKATKSDVYLLNSEYRAQFSSSILLSLIQTDKNYGASHVDERMLVIYDGVYEDKVPRTEADTAMIDLLCEIYISFMNTGKPSIADKVGWKPVGKDGTLNYLIIEDGEHQRPAVNQNFGNNKFWQSLPTVPYRGLPADSCNANTINATNKLNQ